MFTTEQLHELRKKAESATEQGVRAPRVNPIVAQAFPELVKPAHATALYSLDDERPITAEAKEQASVVKPEPVAKPAAVAAAPEQTIINGVIFTRRRKQKS